MDKKQGELYRKKAALQMLCEILGYDEGRMYHLLLTAQDAVVEREFSHSKRYRLTNTLFKAGMIGKVKCMDKNSFQYVVLPASILQFTNADSDLIAFLEMLYANNHAHVLNQTFSQWMLKDERGLIMFMLKHIMQDRAQLVSDDPRAFKMTGVNAERITLKHPMRGVRRRFGVIDGCIAFDFSPFVEHDSHTSIGYIARAISDKECCKVSLVEREFSEF